jgi:thioesterase domain-containing protein
VTAAAAAPAASRSGPPDGETERAVAALWARTLGLDAVDRADSFFALGGDSLLAIRMLRELSAGRETAVSPAVFLAAPTVAGVAAALGAADARRAVAEDVIVPLREGTGAPLFLVHPSGGDVLCYVELSRRLTAPNPVIALADPELSGHPGAEGVPEMAATLLAAVRRHQQHGPYVLGGWSMGGILAHHLACELRARGEEVRLLAMIDSNSPERITGLAGLDAEGSAAETRLRHLRSVAAFLDVDVTAVVNDADGIVAALAAHGVAVPADTWDRQLRVFARHLRGLAVHRAGLLDGSVPTVLLRATRHSPSNGRIGMGVDDAFADPALGWRPHVAAEPRVHRVEAHHYSILRDPAVAEVAAHIDAALRGLGAGPASAGER